MEPFFFFIGAETKRITCVIVTAIRELNDSIVVSTAEHRETGRVKMYLEVQSEKRA